jgi:hypothetical protein
MNRTITRITAGAGIALAGLLIPALGASASTQNAPVQHYSWATGFDSGTSAPTSITENFLITSQSLKDRTGSAENNHSLTETYVRDAAGNAFEFGVTADTFDPTLQPTLFTTAWTAGAFDGYQAGFVSTSSVKPGLFQPPVGSSPEFGYSVSRGTVSFTYGGKTIGYIPASHWPVTGPSPSTTIRSPCPPAPARRRLRPARDRPRLRPKPGPRRRQSRAYHFVT